MEILLIGIIILYIMSKRKSIDTGKFIKDNGDWLQKLKESDYDFLVSCKYGDGIDIEKLYQKRVTNSFIVIVALIFLFLTELSFINILLSFVAGYVMFKMPYRSLKAYYKTHLHEINLELPYFLKSLEVLAQHYTIPVALAKSIDTSPEIFKKGLNKLVQRINDGDSTVEPYMDFAKEYPVNDSMRMMRLLYRLSLGRQERKQEQLLTFSKSISSLQQKARETRYKNRLDKMESMTMKMLITTGVGVMIILILAVLQMINL